MAITCVYCGNGHADAAGVRACWAAGQRAPAAERTAAPERAPAAEETAAPEPPITPAPVVAVVRRGPPTLGRHVLVPPGGAVPPAWDGVPHLTVDAETLVAPELTIVALRDAIAARASLVIHIDASTLTTLRRPVPVDLAPHHVGARFEISREVLAHLVVANAIDLTGATPEWSVMSDAVRAGCRPSPGDDGDVVLPSGALAWLDGGPPRFTAPVDGVGVLHRVCLEHGGLRPFDHNDTSAELAADQRAAVTHTGGAARIIAPAGSGKTRVLTERARHLLRTWHVPAGAVCLVAFNKRAQEEMAERTADLRGLQIRTLNGLALAIVNGTGPFASRPATVATIDENDVRTLIGRLVRFPRKRNADPVATWIEALSLARLGLRDPDDVESIYDGDIEGFASMLPRFRAELARSRQVDFDEQIQLAIELLLTDPAARTVARRSCRLLLVDEFQDLTPAHLLLLRLLAGPDGAVFGVGDDDQTIYGYNGADPAWLIEFATLFPGAGEHPLEVNYRCPGGIVTAAATLLRHNTRRVPKLIRAARVGEEGMHAHAGADPVATTVSIVREHLAAGGSPAEVAVLTRVNSVLAPVQVALGDVGTPVRGGVSREFLERTAVRSALAWLRLATGGPVLATADVAEALRRPSRPLHPNVATWVAEQTSLDGLHRLAERLTTEREAERVHAFADDIGRLQSLARGGGSTARVLGELRDALGLASTIASLDVHRRGMNRSAQNDDLVAIAQLAEQHTDAATFEAWLRAALARPWDAAGVTLATVHRVKGQEWPLVVVHLADADQFPHRLADDVQEERRLFHVAITRASREVHVVSGTAPSPFVEDSRTELSERSRARAVELRPVSTQRAPAAAARPGQSLTGDDAELFESLRAWRRHVAEGKPAYTVLADAALHDVAVARPTTLEALAQVRGVGPAKLERFGDALLAVVETFIAEGGGSVTA